MRKKVQRISIMHHFMCTFWVRMSECYRSSIDFQQQDKWVAWLEQVPLIHPPANINLYEVEKVNLWSTERAVSQQLSRGAFWALIELRKSSHHHWIILKLIFISSMLCEVFGIEQKSYFKHSQKLKSSIYRSIYENHAHLKMKLMPFVSDR